MRLAIFDTEGLGEAVDDYDDATGSESMVFDSVWSKKAGEVHSSPNALMAALRLAEKDPDVFEIMIDSGTDVAHWGRVHYSAANPKKKIPYAMVDAPVAKLNAALKAFTKHWVITFREKDDRDTVDGAEEVVGKRAKAASDLEYIARVKCHCRKTRTKGEVSILCEVADQRGLGDKPAELLVKPTSEDFVKTLHLERYASRPGRRIHAQFFGREATGKSGCALRLMMGLHRVLLGANNA